MTQSEGERLVGLVLMTPAILALVIVAPWQFTVAIILGGMFWIGAILVFGD